LWWIAFEPDQAAQLDALQINLSGWQMATGQDLDSRFADPRLTRNKGTRRYEPEPDSPAHDRANWTAIELPEDHREQFEATHPQPATDAPLYNDPRLDAFMKKALEAAGDDNDSTVETSHSP
ncbi:MAG: hypothetical protein ACQKBW_03210, partial [Puniceicoccales bacterium]